MLSKKNKTILSIDFDFFQNTDAHTMSQYPDGVDLNTEISCVVWASRYVNLAGRENFKDKVKFAQGHYNSLLRILDYQKKDIPIFVCQSHANMYYFTRTLASRKSRLDVINIDMHHDCFENSDDIDCGNWVLKLKEQYKDMSYTWITRPLALKLCDKEERTNLPGGIYKDFTCIRNVAFDAIFICRSDAWLPPHLDEHFDKLKEYVKNKFSNTYVESCVESPRQLNELIEMNQKMYEQMYKT